MTTMDPNQRLEQAIKLISASLGLDTDKKDTVHLTKDSETGRVVGLDGRTAETRDNGYTTRIYGGHLPEVVVTSFNDVLLISVGGRGYRLTSNGNLRKQYR